MIVLLKWSWLRLREISMSFYKNKQVSTYWYPYAENLSLYSELNVRKFYFRRGHTLLIGFIKVGPYLRNVEVLLQKNPIRLPRQIYKKQTLSANSLLESQRSKDVGNYSA